MTAPTAAAHEPPRQRGAGGAGGVPPAAAEPVGAPAPDGGAAGPAATADPAEPPPPAGPPDPAASSGTGRATPTAAAPAHHGPAAPPPGAQVGLYLRQAARDGGGRLLVRLEPEELGRVEVRLDFGRDGRVHALIAADRPETLEALQRDARGLERALQDAGLRPGDDGLSFSLRREGGGHHHHAGRGDGPPAGAGGRAGHDGPAEPRPEPARAAVHALRLLDINA